MVDMVVSRLEMKATIARLLKILLKMPAPQTILRAGNPAAGPRRCRTTRVAFQARPFSRRSHTDIDRGVASAIAACQPACEASVAACNQPWTTTHDHHCRRPRNRAPDGAAPEGLRPFARPHLAAAGPARQSAGSPAAGHPHRRHQRQGLGRRLFARAARGRRLPRPCPHLAASGELARALPAGGRRAAAGWSTTRCWPKRSRASPRPIAARRSPSSRSSPPSPSCCFPSIRPMRRSSRSGSAAASTPPMSSPDPAVSLIMPISLDHEAYLGDRVELIAAEKAGIIKPGCPVVIGAQETETAQDVLVETAERLGCAGHRLRPGFPRL